MLHIVSHKTPSSFLSIVHSSQSITNPSSYMRRFRAIYKKFWKVQATIALCMYLKSYVVGAAGLQLGKAEEQSWRRCSWTWSLFRTVAMVFSGTLESVLVADDSEARC